MGKVNRQGGNFRSAENQNEELVITPGGWRRRSDVHFIDHDCHISGAGGRLRKIHNETGNVEKDFGDIKELSEKAVQNAAQLRSKMSAQDLDPENPAPITDQWIVYSGWTNDSGQPISYFSTNWIVPPAPETDNGQLIYLFNGIQQTTGDIFILQPVLQWGNSPAGGGSYWSITNWYVGSATAMHGSLVNVNPGDNLQGIMTMTGQSGTDFDYLSSFSGFPSADLSVTDIKELAWANETLECYDVTQFSDYPNTPMTAMTDIEIRVGGGATQANINWDVHDDVTDNGQHCVIVSNASPGGSVYLFYKENFQNMHFVVGKSTFGKDEVQDSTSYPNAFWLVLEGFTRNQTVGISPLLSGAFKNLPGISITPNSSGPEFEIPGDSLSIQRIRYPFDITFSNSTLASFPASGSGPFAELLHAAITVGSENLSADTVFELLSGANPYFTNVNTNIDNEFWLSQDLRIFTATPGADNTPVDGGPIFINDSTTGAFNYIQSLLTHLNSNFSNPAGADPFSSVVPNQTGALSNDSSVSPFTIDLSNIFNPQIHKNYNFAIARVRLRGSSGPAGAAQNVKVFFRLWSTQTADTDFQPADTYLSTHSGGHPVAPLVGLDHHTIPFFATGNFSSNSDYASNGVNNRNIEIASGEDSIWAYFGCFLNVYDSGNLIDGQQIQHWLNGTHHCIVAEIAYDGAPIINSNGITKSPENSDKLAQRNLQITLSDNPGGPETHRIPQTFDIRPSQAVVQENGNITTYPDELMIDWGNTPVGSTANIYWPQVLASEVLQLASKLYSTHLLTAADTHTIQCKVTKGITYVPIPAGSGPNFAGLFTLDLPTTVVTGQEFNILVRRMSSRQFRGGKEDQIGFKAAATGQSPRNWRYITGTFQIKIPVSTEETILFPEENTLAIMKWRLQSMSPSYRWYPVLKRYISYISARIDGLGGNSSEIKPSLDGVPVKGRRECEPNVEVTGKVCEVIYDCFGDFKGFILESCCEKHFFSSQEKGIEKIVLHVCMHRMNVSVWLNSKKPDKILKLIVKGQTNL